MDYLVSPQVYSNTTTSNYYIDNSECFSTSSKLNSGMPAQYTTTELSQNDITTEKFNYYKENHHEVFTRVLAGYEKIGRGDGTEMGVAEAGDYLSSKVDMEGAVWWMEQIASNLSQDFETEIINAALNYFGETFDNNLDITPLEYAKIAVETFFGIYDSQPKISDISNEMIVNWLNDFKKDDLSLPEITAYGDSTTYGYNENDTNNPFEKNMIMMAESQLQELGLSASIKNKGINSTTLEDLILSGTFSSNTLKQDSSKIIILNYGLNEACQSASLEDFSKNLNYAVSQAKDAGKIVVLQTPNQVADNIEWGENVYSYVNIIKETAVNHDILLDDKFSQNITLQNDGVHPTNESYGKLGVNLSEILLIAGYLSTKQ